MKRSTYDGDTVVYRYGTPYWADFDDFGMRQLRLANEMRNELVAIEQYYDDLRRAADGQIPDLAAVDEQVNAAAELVSALKERIGRERIKDRSTKTRTATAAELTDARRDLREAKNRRAEVRAQQADARREFRQEIEPERQAIIIAVRQGYARKGLHWGTYNDVLQGMDTTRKRIIERRTRGEPAEFRRHHWDSQGTLHVQNMQQTGKPRRVEWEIVGDHNKHKKLRLRFGLSHTMEIPFVYHRPLPCGSQDVTDVRITRSVVGGKPRIGVNFTVRIPKAERQTTGVVIALRLGWKHVPGGIRIGVAAASGSLLTVPHDLKNVVRLTDHRHADIVMPDEWVCLLKRDDDIRSVRDRMLEELRPHVMKAAKDPVVQELIEGDPSRWRSPARFVGLCRRLSHEHQLYAVIEEWRKRDKHLWQYEAHERDQVVARRKDAWRKVAAWLTEQARRVVISGNNLAEMKMRPVDDEDLYEARGGRKQLQMASPGELRLCVEQAARKRGVEMMYVERGTGNGDGGGAAEPRNDTSRITDRTG